MSQITLTRPPIEPCQEFVVGGEKNLPPTKLKNNFSGIDAAGLSWIFLDDPFGESDVA
jgi:hypothetical protein